MNQLTFFNPSAELYETFYQQKNDQDLPQFIHGVLNELKELGFDISDIEDKSIEIEEVANQKLQELLQVLPLNSEVEHDHSEQNQLESVVLDKFIVDWACEKVSICCNNPMHQSIIPFVKKAQENLLDSNLNLSEDIWKRCVNIIEQSCQKVVSEELTEQNYLDFTDAIAKKIPIVSSSKMKWLLDCYILSDIHRHIAFCEKNSVQPLDQHISRLNTLSECIQSKKMKELAKFGITRLKLSSTMGSTLFNKLLEAIQSEAIRSKD